VVVVFVIVIFAIFLWETLDNEQKMQQATVEQARQ